MFDPETFKETLRLSMPSWSKAQIDAYTDRIAAKYLTVKKGPNVVHLEHFGGMLNVAELKSLNARLQEASLVLSSFDKSGIPYASLQDYQLQSFIGISASVMTSVLAAVAPNAAWDAIKYAVIFCWQRFRFAKTSDTRQPLNFGLKIQLGTNNKLDFRLSGDLTEETALAALDKALDLMRTTIPSEKPQFGSFYSFQPEQQEWKEIDVMAVIR